MRSLIDELLQESDELRELVDSIVPVNEVLIHHSNGLVRQYVTTRRRFDYAAFIVALYASFEKFAEGLVSSYATALSANKAYADLPQGLIKKHLEKSAEILARGRLGEGKYLGLRDVDLVKNIFDCLSGTRPYLLNEVAVTHHELNLRPEQVTKLFSAVGVDGIIDRARKTDPLADWYLQSKKLTELPEDGVPLTSIESKLSELVERRNRVAHRGGSPDELLGHAEMGEFLEFVLALSQGLFTLVVASYLKDIYVEQRKAVPLGKTIEGPYCNDTVVIIPFPDAPISRNQPIFGLSNGFGVRWGRIQSIQANGVPIDYAEPGMGFSDVGLMLDFKCTKGTQLFLVSADDDLVWTP